MSLLITSSFIGAVEWLENSPSSWKERAYVSLHDQLARKPWEEPSADVTRGMKFEQTVYDTLEKKKDEETDFKCSAEFQVFLDKCRGGKFQQKLKRIEEVDGMEFCFYGKTDVSFPDRIIDIKACASYGGSSKYLNTVQHLMYCHVAEVDTFNYLVAEFGPTPNMKIKRVFDVEYKVTDREQMKDTLIKRVRKAVGFVQQDEELWKLYTTTFSRY